MPSPLWRWPRRSRPVAIEQPMSVLELKIISAWELTVADWTSLSHYERSKKRANYTKAPRFVR